MLNNKLMINRKGNAKPKKAIGQKRAGEMYLEVIENNKLTIII